MDLDTFMELYPWAYDKIKFMVSKLLNGQDLMDVWVETNLELQEKNLIISVPQFNPLTKKLNWDLQGQSDTGLLFKMPMEM